MKTKASVSIFHPFSAKAIGLDFNDIVTSHSKPHQIALQYLKELGYSVNMSYFFYSYLSKRINFKGVDKVFWPVSSPRFSKKSKWRNEASLMHYYNTSFKPSDVTIINMSGHLSLYTLKLGRLLYNKKKPYIAMIGGLNMGNEKPIIDYYKQAHHIIVHTQNQKQSLLENYAFKNTDIRVVPLGIDTSVFKPDTKLNSDFKLLYVGRISRLKQIELVIDALDFNLKKGLDCKLTIIGPVSDKDYYKELLNKVKSLKLENQVEFLGAVAHNQLVNYYQKASALLLPSKHESFGMVAVEAMACETPVVAIKGSGGPEEIITHKVDGYLSDSSHFSESVFEVLNNKELLSVLSSNSRKTALEKYSITVTSSLIHQSVKDALQNG